MPDLEHARLMLRLAQDDIAAIPNSTTWAFSMKQTGGEG
jgi:hypothetical protein